MQNNITQNLSTIGFSQYRLDTDGKLYKLSPALT